MRKLAQQFILLLLLMTALASPLVSYGQSLLPIPLEACVWHVGDDPSGALGWAKPEFNDSAWSPYANGKLNLKDPRIWVRCHADLSSLRATRHPALQVNILAAYQIFVDGSLAGAFGNMKTGDFTADAIRTFPLADPFLNPSPRQAGSIIVLRLLRRVDPKRAFSDVLKTDSQEILVGDRGSLMYRRDSLALIDGLRQLPATVTFGIVGIAGFMLLGLYLNDRSKLAFLYFAINCWALASLRVLQQLEASYYPISTTHYRLAEGFLVAALPFIVFMVYALAQKPVPLFYLIISGLSLAWPLLEFITALSPAEQSLRIDTTLHWYAVVSTLIFDGLMFLSPFIAFSPWRRLSGSARYVAATLMLWALGNEVFVLFRLGLNLSLSLFAPFFKSWMPIVQPVRAAMILSSVIVLLILLFRDQRKTAQERAQLAGELEAAREIQQRLVPAALPRTPGFHVEAAYRPAAEVGGDFYQVIPQRDGAALIVIGDVSGKGLKAAMTGTLAIGALRALASENERPAAILTRLNEQMVEAGHDGFITCLILRIEAGGWITLTNAGHLSPYRNGVEIPVENGLPLGLTSAIEYAEFTLQLDPGDKLTLLTDGILEARNHATGELFGFDRTAAISTESAENIARAAQHFGQEDDITVLTLTRLNEAVHA